jgi:hypothetical protein
MHIYRIVAIANHEHRRSISRRGMVVSKNLETEIQQGEQRRISQPEGAARSDRP